jgi:hypothetical protein
MRLPAIFGMVHSGRTVVEFYTLFNSVSITTNCMHAAVSKSNVTAYVNNSFIFFKLAYVIFLFGTDCFLLIFHLGFTK